LGFHPVAVDGKLVQKLETAIYKMIKSTQNNTKHRKHKTENKRKKKIKNIRGVIRKTQREGNNNKTTYDTSLT